MRSITAVAALIASGIATAQTQVAIPPFQNTYTSSGATRGLYFQAPVAFTVVGLRVPDETNHGMQNVALYNMSTRPPAFSGSATGGLQVYKGGVSSSLVIPVNVSYNQGDWLGVLGACGDSTTMRNSYSNSSNGFATMVLGQPTTMYRFLTQTNIVTTQGSGAYSAEDAFQLSRIEIYVNGVTVQGAGPATPGTTMNFGLSSPKDAGLPYQVATSLGTGPTPIGQRSLGLTLDSLFAASVSGNLPTVFVNYAGAIGASGNASAALNIPPFAVLKGITLHTAFVTFSGSAPLGVQSISTTFTFQIQ